MQGMADTKKIRVRIAPSPTGYPHIGTIYQALFNFAYARRHNGDFVVRIEDTDRARFVEGSEEVIFASLDWFGLTEDESPRKSGEVGPYRQSERLSIYHKYAQELLDKGHAYFDYYPRQDAGVKKDYAHGKENNNSEKQPDAPRSVAEMLTRSDWVLRMKVPDQGEITVRDEIRGDIIFAYKEVSKQILLKSDGFPTYHLGVVVDDHLMGITDIVRAEEWISSLPKHVLLYQYFGWDMPRVYHTATLRNPDKSKLSKRHGHTNVNWFREEGYIQEAILNYLALLGWSHPEEKEIFSLSEFIKLFDLKDIRPVAPIFDLTKLNWMNQQYIQAMSDAELKQHLLTHFPDLPDTSLLDNLLPLLKTRMTVLNDFTDLTWHFFADPDIYRSSESAEKEAIVSAKEALSSITNWNKDEIFAALKAVMQEKNVRMPFFYTVFTGNNKGLPLPESLAILGKEKTLGRLDMIT